MQCALEIDSIGGLKWGYVWNLALQPLKTFLYYHITYGHQPWPDGDILEELLLIKLLDPSITWFFEVT